MIHRAGPKSCAFLHLEFQNQDNTTNAIVTIDSVKVRHLSGFTPP